MSKEGRGFFLFSAINGLFERARSSAEKESQRLFTGDESTEKKSQPLVSNEAPGRSPHVTNILAAAGSRKRKSAPLAESLSRIRNRPKPPRVDSQAPRKRTVSRSSPVRASSAMSVRTQLAATVDSLVIKDAALLESIGGPMPVPVVKRKRESRASHASPKKPRVSDVSSALRVSSTQSSTTAVSAPVADNTTYTAESDHTDEFDRPETGITASTQTPVKDAERQRLEKVERELHRLKKIIASLLPDELNDDDLRSVYGDLDRPRLSTDDVIARMVKARFGTQLPTPTSGPSGDGLPEIPLPPPLPPINEKALNTAHASAVAAVRGHSQVGGRARRAGSTSEHLRRGSGDSSLVSQTNKKSPRLPVPSIAQLRHTVLQPVAPKPDKPPHKDPGVMSMLLEEMKHHKLRSVAKPKDMGSR
ncbi:hypothetical protein IWW56_004526 [Coemansia sp. RSA 2131]|nr:hypothetical protein IWW56_004526 [Coemansia sp. RSA 2131]